VTTTPTLACLTTLVNWFGSNQGIPCLTYGSQAAANAIVVTQTAVVPTFFARVLGVSTVTVSAVATASSKGGTTPPLNVIIVLDTTPSMGTADTHCSVPGHSNPSRLDCATYGVQVLLGILSSSVDQVGLMVFPGLKDASQVAKEYDCSASSIPQIADYTTAAKAVYGIISSSTDYRASGSTSLDPNSNLTKAVSLPGVAGSSCSGLSPAPSSPAVNTYFAGVITAAQAALTASQQTGQQNVIIFIGDGDSNANPKYVGTGNTKTPSSTYNPTAMNQCHQAITAAQAATAAGTWVYSVAYGASTSSSGSCSTDTPHISACSTLQQMASNSSKFYSDNASGCTSTNAISALSSIFQNIGLSLLNSRLIPNGTV
jgi:hypothetical protein